MPGYSIRLMRIAAILLAISFFVEALTAVGMMFLRNVVLKLGIFHLILKVHVYNGFIFAALVAVHIYFNWGWVRVNILKK